MSWSRVWIGRIIAVCAVGAAIWTASVVLDRMDREVWTHDALLFADNIGLAPDVSGRIVALRVKNNQRVAEGDILVEIDPEPFDLKLRRARAQVVALQAQIDLTTRQVAGQATGADAAATQIARARAQLGYAQDTVSRLTPLLDKGYVTVQQVDEAQTNQKVAQAGVTSAIQQAEEARQKVGDTASLKAQLASAEADIGLAERDVRNASLRAPFDGLVVGLSIATGAYASEGRPLFTLIKTHDWYAIGNFRETQLPGIAIGDPATVWLMSDNNHPIRGHVESRHNQLPKIILGIKRPCSASPACRNAQSPRLWAGTRSMPRGSSGGTSTAALRPRQSFGCSTKREREVQTRDKTACARAT